MEVKKNGHGKGGWGDKDLDKLAHRSADGAEELILADVEGDAIEEHVTVHHVEFEKDEDHKGEHKIFEKTDENFPSLE